MLTILKWLLIKYDCQMRKIMENFDGQWSCWLKQNSGLHIHIHLNQMTPCIPKIQQQLVKYKNNLFGIGTLPVIFFRKFLFKGKIIESRAAFSKKIAIWHDQFWPSDAMSCLCDWFCLGGLATHKPWKKYSPSEYHCGSCCILLGPLPPSLLPLSWGQWQFST